MELLSLILTAVAFAMDAFAVSLCKGLGLKEFKIKYSLFAGLWFGIFQAVMPLIGYFVSNGFIKYIESFDHWIAFGLLVFIGIKMIVESFSGEEIDADFSFKTMLVLAIATSIDALAGGVTFAVNGSDIILAVILIGSVTFALSFAGVGIGNKFGVRFKTKAEIAGGIILIILAIKIVVESYV